MRILVAEDDPVTRMVLVRVLESMGNEVVAVSDGQQAWDCYVQQFFPVIITDWMMPNVNGIELAQMIRRARYAHYTWMIMLTSRDYKQNHAYSVAAGIDDYLTKPLNRELLRVRLHVAARVCEMSDRLRQLESALPICSSCKNIKEAGNQWEKIESYLSKNAGLALSHAICPDCHFNESLLPELEQCKKLFPIPSRTAQEMANLSSSLDKEWLRSLQMYEQQMAPGFFQELVEDFLLAVTQVHETLKSIEPTENITQIQQKQLMLFRTRAHHIGAFQLSAQLAPRHLRKLLRPNPERWGFLQQISRDIEHVVDTLHHMGMCDTADEIPIISQTQTHSDTST